MRSPGSEPNIPKSAIVTFERNKRDPDRLVAFLSTDDGGSLTVFPHRDWQAKAGIPIDCYLFLLDNAAIAVPKLGFNKAYVSREAVMDLLNGVFNEIDAAQVQNHNGGEYDDVQEEHL